MRAGPTVSVDSKLRVPSWSTTPTVAITIVDSRGTVVDTLSASRGSYAHVSLLPGHSALYDVAPGLSAVLYNGTTPADPSGCNTTAIVRAAVSWGPILLAATVYAGPECATAGVFGAAAGLPSIVSVDPRDPPETWLTRNTTAGASLAFAVKGNPCVVFRPYYELQACPLYLFFSFLPF